MGAQTFSGCEIEDAGNGLPDGGTMNNGGSQAEPGGAGGDNTSGHGPRGGVGGSAGEPEVAGASGAAGAGGADGGASGTTTAIGGAGAAGYGAAGDSGAPSDSGAGGGAGASGAGGDAGASGAGGDAGASGAGGSGPECPTQCLKAGTYSIPLTATFSCIEEHRLGQASISDGPLDVTLAVEGSTYSVLFGPYQTDASDIVLPVTPATAQPTARGFGVQAVVTCRDHSWQWFEGTLDLEVDCSTGRMIANLECDTGPLCRFGQLWQSTGQLTAERIASCEP